MVTQFVATQFATNFAKICLEERHNLLHAYREALESLQQRGAAADLIMSLLTIIVLSLREILT